MLVFRKIWGALFSCYLRFKSRHSALLPTKYPIVNIEEFFKKFFVFFASVLKMLLLFR